MLFAITCHDKPASAEIRQTNRPAHLDFAAEHSVVIGGPLLDEAGQPCGSMLVIDAPDRAAAEAFVAGDPYGLAGLFERVTIHGYRTVFKDGERM